MSNKWIKMRIIAVSSVSAVKMNLHKRYKFTIIFLNIDISSKITLPMNYWDHFTLMFCVVLCILIKKFYLG